MATTRSTKSEEAAGKASGAKAVPGKSTVKAAARKAAAKKSAPVTGTSGTKASSKKAPGKTSSKSAGRKYSPAAGKQVAKELHEMHRGQLKIGKSDKKVTNPKQAIAIGLAEARRAGKRVPLNPNESSK